MRKILNLIAALVMSACVQPLPVNPTENVVPLSALKSDGTAGTATVHVAFPCHLGNIFVPNALVVEHYVAIDGVNASQIMACQYRDIQVPAGKHAIRLRWSKADAGDLLGNNGEIYVLPAGQHLYFVAVGMGNNQHKLSEVAAEQHASVVTQIDKDTKKQGSTPGPAAAAAQAVMAAARSPNGATQVHIVWPCLDSAIANSMRANAMRSRWNIVVDEKPSGNAMTECSHMEVPVASGARVVRLADPMIDIPQLVGKGPPSIDVSGGHTVYLRARTGNVGNVSLYQIDASRAAGEIAEIEKFMAKTASTRQ